MINPIQAAKELLERNGYHVVECVPTETGGHLYVDDPVHCSAGKCMRWVETRKVRIDGYATACRFIDERS